MQLLLGWNLLQISTWLAIALSRHPGYERIPSSRLSNSCRVVGLGSFPIILLIYFQSPLFSFDFIGTYMLLIFKKWYNTTQVVIVHWFLDCFILSTFVDRIMYWAIAWFTMHGYPTFGIVGILHHTWNMTF